MKMTKKTMPTKDNKLIPKFLLGALETPMFGETLKICFKSLKANLSYVLIGVACENYFLASRH
jgi:hypothetical protein